MFDNTHLNRNYSSLEIRLNSNGVNYAVSDEEGRVVLRQEISVIPGSKDELQLLDYFFSRPELQVFNDNVVIVFENSDYMLIPNDMYRDGDTALQFNLLYDEKSFVDYIVNIIPKWNLHFVFRVNSRLISFFNQRYPSAEIKHHLADILKKNIDKLDAMTIHYFKNKVIVCVVKDSSLYFLNEFEIKTIEDACYHILNIYKELEINNETFKLQIISSKQTPNDLIELLKKYVKIVDLR